MTLVKVAQEMATSLGLEGIRESSFLAPEAECSVRRQVDRSWERVWEKNIDLTLLPTPWSPLPGLSKGRSIQEPESKEAMVHEDPPHREENPCGGTNSWR